MDRLSTHSFDKEQLQNRRVLSIDISILNRLGPGRSYIDIECISLLSEVYCIVLYCIVLYWVYCPPLLFPPGETRPLTKFPQDERSSGVTCKISGQSYIECIFLLSFFLLGPLTKLKNPSRWKKLRSDLRNLRVTRNGSCHCLMYYVVHCCFDGLSVGNENLPWRGI
jgi:hypothetical protein